MIEELSDLGFPCHGELNHNIFQIYFLTDSVGLLQRGIKLKDPTFQNLLVKINPSVLKFHFS